MNYAPKLSLIETEQALKYVKDTFERELSRDLHLTRVSAPLFLDKDSGLNDDLNGVERPVAFDVKETGVTAEVVHSLAKWKRHALSVYRFGVGNGLYTDMNAIRRDEECDAIHSLYVDQWDWEKVITDADRTVDFLKSTVRQIYRVIYRVADSVRIKYPQVSLILPKDITFLTAQDMEDRWPQLSPREREAEAAREYGAIFIIGIGGAMKSGKKHDGRAPDYDDWNLNGDIIVYYPLLDIPMELSSMGIRVDKASLASQLAAESQQHRLELPFHKSLMNDELPLTIGGGIGQSRLCMFMLEKAHIGEVQASLWPAAMVRRCAEEGVPLL